MFVLISDKSFFRRRIVTPRWIVVLADFLNTNYIQVEKMFSNQGAMRGEHRRGAGWNHISPSMFKNAKWFSVNDGPFLFTRVWFLQSFKNQVEIPIELALERVSEYPYPARATQSDFLRFVGLVTPIKGVSLKISSYVFVGNLD